MHRQVSKDTNIDLLYERHASTLFSYLRQHARSREDAEDLLLEVFTAALEDIKLAQLPERAQVAWLWRVARNKVVDAFRSSAIRQSLPLEYATELIDDDDAQNPEQAALRTDQIMLAQRLLKRLSPFQQEVLRLRFGYDLRCAEIAAILGKREPAIRTMLSRTMNLLRSMYGQH